jgi:ABC-type bacteriocin/lantibiotic exporter with double-glycine peptidase domain
MDPESRAKDMGYWRLTLIVLACANCVGVADAQTRVLGIRPGTGERTEEFRERIPKKSSPQPIEGVIPTKVGEPKPECGLNALYMLLKLRDRSCTYDDLARELPLEKKGLSMLALRDASRRHGLNCEVAEAPPASLTPYVPLIVRMNSDKDPENGHYLVITSSDSDIIQAIDSANGTFRMMKQGAFERQYSGYALVPSSTAPLSLTESFNFTSILATVVASELVVVAALLVRRLRTQPAPNSR